MPKTKKWIDKRDPNTHTFSLVHRSQRDPLISDPDAPKRVLAPHAPPNSGNKPRKPPVVPKGAIEAPQDKQEVFRRKADLAEAGVLFDDDYDYSQHLRTRAPEGDGEVYLADPKDLAKVLDAKGVEAGGDGPAVPTEAGPLELPSDMLGSAREEDVGMLNRAAPVTGPRLDWDPEVLAALDDDFDFDDPNNVLSDNFFDAVNADELILEDEGGEGGYYGDSDGWETDEADDGMINERLRGLVPRMGADDEDRLPGDARTERSRFTEYSMTSSILPRSEALQHRDAHFEKLYEQYDEEKLGALDEVQDDIQGNVDLADVQDVLDSFLEDLQSTQAADIDASKDATTTKKVANAVLQLVDAQEKGGGKEPMEEVLFEESAFDKTWDCETILTTRSTLYNHPRRIVENSKKIKVNRKTGMPVVQDEAEAGPSEGGAAEGNAADGDEGEQEEEESEPINHGVARAKTETAEEKRQRKKAIKEARKERRQTKKATKDAFREEELKQKKNIDARANVRVIQIS